MFHTYLAIEDALFELDEGRYTLVKENLELAKEYYETFLSIIKTITVDKNMRNEIFTTLGVNIPKDYTLVEALDVIEELSNGSRKER